MTRIKCCGMFREADIEAVNATQPDMVGFVVEFPKSHRSITKQRLAELAPLVAEGIERVGVFVDAPVELVARLADQRLIDIAQLHGHEDEAYIASLRAAALGLRIIRAFKVRTSEDVARAEASSADLVLLDNGQGTGERFDWSLVQHVGRDFILAGGLTPENVTGAIAATHPWAVDLSSGLETDRLKDPAKIEAAVDAVRRNA